VSNELTGSPSAPLALCQWSEGLGTKWTRNFKISIRPCAGGSKTDQLQRQAPAPTVPSRAVENGFGSVFVLIDAFWFGFFVGGREFGGESGAEIVADPCVHLLDGHGGQTRADLSGGPVDCQHRVGASPLCFAGEDSDDLSAPD